MIGRLLLLGPCLLLASGCATSFRETHFFAVGNGDGPAGRNYYRLKVKGGTAIASSRYTSGYFDPAAVDLYFNEIKQPENAAIQKREEAAEPLGVKSSDAGRSMTASEIARGAGSPNPGGTAEPHKPEAARQLVPGPTNKELVLIMSTNSEEIANQIGALAQSQQFTAALAGVLTRDQRAAAATESAALALDADSAKALVALADSMIGKLPEAPTAEQNVAATLPVLNRLAFELDHAGPFATLELAEAWFTANRNRIAAGGSR